MDASYQVSVYLAKGFQRRGFLEIGQSEKRIACSDQRGRLKCEKLADDGQRMPSDGKSSHCLWQVELKRQVTF